MSFFTNIFPWMGKEGGEDELSSVSSSCNTKKRSRTPSLVRHVHTEDIENTDSIRPLKIFRGENERKIDSIELRLPRKILTKKRTVDNKNIKKKSPLEALPEDALSSCLSFVSSKEDRFAIQCTSKQFQKISNSPDFMKQVELDGILMEKDTPKTAAEKLTPFALSGNLEALYMLGIIKSYCHCDVEHGIALLKMAAARQYVRAAYALGLILRDAHPSHAYEYMKQAADAQYLPALQELLSAREMKQHYGEPGAEELRKHLDDHACLNNLLSRHYIKCRDLRKVNTSHCWNPLCGRWAFKANGIGPSTCNHKYRVSRMKMCSRCCRAKYCSKLCQVYDWRSGRHKMECQFL